MTAPPVKPPATPVHERASGKIIVGVVTSLIAAALGSIVGWVSSQAWTHYKQSQQTIVTIQAPLRGTEFENNGFGAAGYITGPQPSSKHFKLWLVIKAGGLLYPFGPLTLDDRSWTIPPERICTGVGAQSIQIYAVPDVDNGSLQAYIYNGSKQHLDAFQGDMPKTAELAAQTDVTVLKATDC